ncbi:MAG TPA: hypothetical protein VJV23_02810 [Candidatus Polarisedimenticolia bacterium]|nr:hypothetical protein [Candidatus Polarisedimenticolia bacterium]
MSPDKKRQTYLLVLLFAAAAAWLRFGSGIEIGEASAAPPEEVPPIDVVGLTRAIEGVGTIDQTLIGVNKPDSDPDRNLFQYGHRRPPPPTPEEEERRRKAAEEALKVQEAQLRAQKEAEALRLQQEEQARAQREAEAAAQQQLAQQHPPTPPPPPRPEPPPINFKLMGIMGSPQKKLGVFLDGDKLMMARQGEQIDGKFKVLTIDVEWAEIGFVDPQFKDRSKRIHLGQ